MKRKENETPRQLTEQEEKRTAKVEAMLSELEQKGYRRQTVTISVLKANIYAILWLVPFAVLFIGLYNALGCKSGSELDNISGLMIFVIILVALVFVHEGLHGITFASFAPHHFQSIEFGVIWKYLTPYCCCTEPVSRPGYVLSAFMPCLVLGIVPCVVSLCTGSVFLLVTGLIMISGAGGDLTIIAKVLAFRTGGKEALFVDHPTGIGFIAMVKDAH